MDTIFWICVKIMQVMSKSLGITYEQLNVILFVILHPAITIFLFLKYRKYKRLWKENLDVRLQTKTLNT
jgi:mannose/fructose/N-acetylgalactosamine-specific phosphotransferase system component IID